MKKKGKVLSTLIVGCMLAASLVACGTKQGNDGDDTSKDSTSEDSQSSESVGNEADKQNADGDYLTDELKSVWPTGEVQILVPNATGGITDMVGRMFAEYVSDESGENVYVVNETGGANTVAFDKARSAAPDGSTLLTYSNTAFLNYYAGKLEYNVMDPEEYTMLNFISQPTDTFVSVFCVASDSKYETMEDLLEDARNNPGTVTVGDGYATSASVSMGQIEMAADVKFKHVSCEDNSSRITALLGGQIDMAPLSYYEAQSYKESGDMRILAMEGSVDFDPEVPTMESLGYEGVSFKNMSFVIGPAGMDEKIIDSISAWCQQFTVDRKAGLEEIKLTGEPWDREDVLTTEEELDDYTREIAESLGWSR